MVLYQTSPIEVDFVVKGIIKIYEKLKIVLLKMNNECMNGSLNRKNECTTVVLPVRDEDRRKEKDQWLANRRLYVSLDRGTCPLWPSFDLLRPTRLICLLTVDG